MLVDLLQTPPAFAAAASCHQFHSRLCRKSPPGQLHDLWLAADSSTLYNTLRHRPLFAALVIKYAAINAALKADPIRFALIRKCRCHKLHQIYNAFFQPYIQRGWMFFVSLHDSHRFSLPSFPLTVYPPFSLHHGSIKIPLPLRSWVLMVGLVLMMTAIISGQTDGWCTLTHTHVCFLCLWAHAALSRSEKRIDDKFFYIWNMTGVFWGEV